MSFGRTLLRRAFGCPEGLLGRFGGILMARMNRACAASALDLLGLDRRDRVLEIGFGPGIAIALAAQTARDIAGVDPSPVMLAQARARNADAVAAGRADLRLGTADDLPFEDGGFDAVFAVNSMQLWPDRAAALAEIRRVLGPHGRVAFGFTPNSGQVRDGLAEAVARGGFANARVVDRDGDFIVLAVKAA